MVRASDHVEKHPLMQGISAFQEKRPIQQISLLYSESLHLSYGDVDDLGNLLFGVHGDDVVALIMEA